MIMRSARASIAPVTEVPFINGNAVCLCIRIPVSSELRNNVGEIRSKVCRFRRVRLKIEELPNRRFQQAEISLLLSILP